MELAALWRHLGIDSKGLQMGKNGFVGAFAGMLAAFGLALAAFCFMLTLGCVDPEDSEGGGVGGTSLYVFDCSNGAANNRVLVYSDVLALFNDPETKPSKTLRSSLLEQVKELAWGGMCFDANKNMLYMVSETGGIVRIDRARSQRNNVEIPANEIAFFRLGESGQRLSNGKFGQAAVDLGSGALYITEYNSSESRIWVLPNPGGLTNGAVVSNGNIMDLRLYGDGGGGSGVAVGSGGAIYAYIDDGTPFTMPTTGVSYSGPRLRKGNSSGFQWTQSMIIGESSDDKPKLGRYGTLAVDSSGNVFFAKHLTENLNSSGPALLVFAPVKFNPGMNVEPSDAFSSVPNLRVLSHAFTKDWLVGATSNTADTAGSGTIWIWQAPMRGAEAACKQPNLGSNRYIRGLALDGSN